MTQASANSIKIRSAGITFLSIVNSVAFFITILFWGMVFFRRLVPFPGELSSLTERANSAVTYGFMIGDILYSAPLLLFSWFGLWRLKSWGWMSAQMANALWIYSMTIILLRDSYTSMSPGGLLFIPFTIVAIWSIPYLWMRRKDFNIN
ncbi:MAG: hypothetical protein WAR79_09975 [Melioribacteraceae bacterium]